MGQTVNFSLLLAVIVTFLVITAGLLTVVLRQRTQLNTIEQQRPKTGFLGKPLLSMAAMALMAGGFALTYYASQHVENVSVSADLNIELQVKTQVGLLVGGQSKVDFNVIPMVDGTEWGEDVNVKFDAFWSIEVPNNPVPITDVEFGLSKLKQGGISRNLPVGSYKAKVDVMYQKRTWTKEFTFTVGL